MQLSTASSKAWWATYVVWAALCAAAFVALGDAGDPSRPKGRISPYLAEIVALEHLESIDGSAYARFETVDAAIYRDPASGRRIWLVLCDDEMPTRLARAVVVEIDARSGTVIRVRLPDGAPGLHEGAR
ncbi:MAG: hypothetical protein ACSLFQ_14845 [Thermoanaerobaculia bacterium]